MAGPTIWKFQFPSEFLRRIFDLHTYQKTRLFIDNHHLNLESGLYPMRFDYRYDSRETGVDTIECWI